MGRGFRALRRLNRADSLLYRSDENKLTTEKKQQNIQAGTKRGVADLSYPLMRTHKPVVRGIGVSYTACKDEFRQNPPSHSWNVFSFSQYFLKCQVLSESRRNQSLVRMKFGGPTDGWATRIGGKGSSDDHCRGTKRLMCVAPRYNGAHERNDTSLAE